MATKLQRLLEKEAQLKAQIQQAKAAERTLEKKRDTRRKILIGAAVMARVENGEWPRADLDLMMDGFLTRQHERDLFGLDGEPEAAEKGKQGRGKTTAQGKQLSIDKQVVERLPEAAPDTWEDHDAFDDL